MILCSFVLRAIPVRKVFTGVACVIILITGMALVNNYNIKLKDFESIVFTNSNK